MRKLLALVSLVSFLAINNFVIAEDTVTPATEETILYVDINNDSAEKMADLLSGIGIKKAEAIVEYRTTVGIFETIEDLLNVKGVGPSTLEKNRSRIRLSSLNQ